MFNNPAKKQGSAVGEDAVASANGSPHVNERQNAIARIVAAAIIIMNRHTAAYVAAVQDHGVGQEPDLLQRNGGALREQTDAVFVVGREARDMIAAVVDRREIECRSPKGVVDNLRDG